MQFYETKLKFETNFAVLDKNISKKILMRASLRQNLLDIFGTFTVWFSELILQYVISITQKLIFGSQRKCATLSQSPRSFLAS